MRRPSSSQPASSPEHAPPRDRPTAEGLSPPLPARPRRPGPRLPQTARSALARGGTGATAATAASGSHPERGREGRKTNNKTWLLVPSGNRGPSGAERRGGLRTSGAAERSPARSPARARDRVTAPPRPAGPAPPRPVPVAGLWIRPRLGSRLPTARLERWTACRERTVLYVTGSGLHRARGWRRPGLGVGSVCRLCPFLPEPVWPWGDNHRCHLLQSCGASKQAGCIQYHSVVNCPVLRSQMSSFLRPVSVSPSASGTQTP